MMIYGRYIVTVRGVMDWPLTLITQTAAVSAPSTSSSFITPTRQRQNTPTDATKSRDRHHWHYQVFNKTTDRPQSTQETMLKVDYKSH